MYFEVEQHPFKRVPELDGHRSQYPVVVVGAGPVGLTVALDLARQGVPVIVLEQRAAIAIGSRAVGIRRRSMQVFDKLGISKAIADKAIPFERGWVYYGTRLVQEMSMKDRPEEKHPALLMLQQCWIEQVLVDRATVLGIEIRWSSRVMLAQAVSGAAELEVETPEGRYSLSADFVVAADGAHSDLRNLLGLRYQGKSFEQRWAIADFHMPSDLPAGRRLWFSPPYAPESTTLLHRLPFDVWRLDFLLDDNMDAGRAANPEVAHSRITTHLEMMGVTDRWALLDTSIYRPNALSMSRYRQGPFFFIGDAAHLLPIFSGRGMNHGIEDAFNLGWKLAAVINGNAPSGILDTFDLERRPVLLHTLDALSRTTIYMGASSKGAHLMREAALSLSLSQPSVRSLFEPFGLEDPGYVDSPLNASSSQEHLFSAAAGPGNVLPDFPLIWNRPRGEELGQCEPASLHDFLGHGYTLIYWQDNKNLQQATGHSPAQWHDVDPAVRLVTITGSPGSDPLAGELIDQNFLGKELLDAEPGCVYLLRPDLIVAGRWRQYHPDTVIDALRTVKGLHL